MALVVEHMDLAVVWRLAFLVVVVESNSFRPDFETRVNGTHKTGNSIHMFGRIKM